MTTLVFCLLLPAAVRAQLMTDPGFDPYPVDSGSRTGLEQQVEQHLQSVQHRISRGDYAAALAEINEALSIVPEHPLLLQYAAHIYAARGAYILAEDCWSRLRETDPENGYYATGLAGMYIRQGLMQKAIPFLNAALQQDPLNLPARYNLALVRMSEGADSEVQRLLCARGSAETGKLCSWIAEEHRIIHALLGRERCNRFAALVLEGKLPPDNEALEMQTPEKLKRVSDYTYQSFQAAEENKWGDAILFLKRAREAGAVGPAVSQDLAVYAWMNGSREKSRKLLESLAARFPEHPSITATLGLLCLKEDLAAEAVRHLKEAFRTDPANAEALFALACAYAQMEETTRARMALEKLQRLLKKHPALTISTDEDYAKVLKEHEELNAFLVQLEAQKNAPKNP